MRRELHESSQFEAIERSVERFPIVTVFKKEFFFALAGIFLAGLCAVVVTSLFLFTPSYLTEILHWPANAHVWERTVAIATGAFLATFFGHLTDRFKVGLMVLIASITTIILAYPIYFIYAYYPHLYLLAFAASALLLGLSAGVIPRLLSELFPTKIRYSGIAVSYNLGFAIFGGMTPFVSLF